MRIIGGIRLSQVAKETGYYSSDLKYLGKRI